MFGYVILVTQQVASVQYRPLKSERTEAVRTTGAFGKYHNKTIERNV